MMDDLPEIKIHFRRCHVCSHVNCIPQGLVERCEKCHKVLASYYFFDEYRALGIINPHQAHMVSHSTSSLPLREYPPLAGVTVYWED